MCVCVCNVCDGTIVTASSCIHFFFLHCHNVLCPELLPFYTVHYIQQDVSHSVVLSEFSVNSFVPYICAVVQYFYDFQSRQITVVTLHNCQAVDSVTTEGKGELAENANSVLPLSLFPKILVKPDQTTSQTLSAPHSFRSVSLVGAELFRTVALHFSVKCIMFVCL